jgi:Ion channel
MKGLRERKNLVLLLLLVLMLGLQPLTFGFLSGLILYDVLFAALLLGVFLVAFERGQQRLVSLAIVVPAFAANWAYHGLAGRPQEVAAGIFHGFGFLFFAFAVAVILRGLFEQKVIRADHVVGSCCGYLLVGVAWANLYMFVALVSPGSFHVNQEIAWQLGEEHTRRFLFNYFSLATLTTVGYGDITPIRPAASSLAVLEAVFGQFYVAVVVAQLVGQKLAQAVRKEDAKPE